MTTYQTFYKVFGGILYRNLLFSFTYLSHNLFLHYFFLHLRCSFRSLSSAWINSLEVSSMKAIRIFSEFCLSYTSLFFPHSHKIAWLGVHNSVLMNVFSQLWEILFHLIVLVVDFEIFVFGFHNNVWISFMSPTMYSCVSYIQGFMS